MSAFSAEHNVSLNCADGATDDVKIACLAGDGGYLVGPAHIAYKALGHIPGVFVASGPNYVMPPRLMDAAGMRGYFLTEALSAKVLASWVTGPERWARFFQDLAGSGGLTGDVCASVEKYGDRIGQAAQKLTGAQRSLDVGDTIDVEIIPAAGRARGDAKDDEWFITLTGKQACPGRACGPSGRACGTPTPHASRGGGPAA